MYPKLESHVEGHLFRLRKKIADFMQYHNVSYKEICNYLTSMVAEMGMKYHPRKIIPFTIGDVVDCNYGYHLESEVSGGHIHAIVCNIIENNLVYLVPIAKEHFSYEEKKLLPIIPNEDIYYHSKQFHGGTAFIKLGKYMDAHRFREVIGEVHEEYLRKLLFEIQKAACFGQEITTKNDQIIESFESPWDFTVEEPIDDLH